jgi:hypothetical protein
VKTCKNCKAFEWGGCGSTPFCTMGYKVTVNWVNTPLGAAPIGYPTAPCEKPTTNKKLVELQLARQRK